MLRDSRSYETQLVDAVRSVNRALGGTYCTSSAIYKNEYNQFEVQLIDAIKGIGRTLSGNGISIKGGIGGGEVSAVEFQDLSRRVSKLESESFFRLVDGNITLKEQYRNLWVPGWLAAGGIGEGGGGGSTSIEIEKLAVTSDTNSQIARIRVDGGSWTYLYNDVGWGSYDQTNHTVALTVNGTTRIVALDGYGGGGGGGYSSLSGLSDVSLSSPSNGQALIYRNGVWQNETIPGGGSVTGYIGTTQVQSTSSAQALTGILSVKATSATSSLMEWDSTNNAWHFYGNVYADGWVSAGGVGSGSGGGGYIDVDSELSTTSENPVQNKVITTALGTKANASEACFIGEIIATV